ncbi:MAG: DUF4339 domain-containing protein [Aeromicrobium sp.]|uniref:DUF4339 domain-containing protein n=1 Tax=Aeromicrobium sp. TaxID=1871063 RepID=UPI00260A906C|nr:DUF4339 domain-containing protein [Aeromicrobium sp.]MDF1704533.1 DUF4339 domain-containing protein [Aeromicrobium sp.]
MTSTTPPPAPVEATPADTTSVDDGRPVRRFGTARTLALAVAAFLGGYLALMALTQWVDIVRNDLWSVYDPFGSNNSDGRFRLLALGAESFGALAGGLAIIGLAARRLAVGVLVVTLVSALLHVGFAVQIIDTNFRSSFLEPNRSWSPSSGLPFLVVVLALQALIVLLCLVRGPRPEPVVALAPPVPHVDGTPPPATPAQADLPADDHDSAAAGAAVAADEEDAETDDDVFLVIHGQEYGPYPTERVRGFMVEGRIHPGTLVRIGDETKPASEVPAIYGS